MQRLALLAALLIPALAQGFEVGELLVCIRSCEVKNGDKLVGIKLPGQGLRVAAEKDGHVQDEGHAGGWVQSEHLIAAKDSISFFRSQIERNPDDIESRCGLAMRIDQSHPDDAMKEAIEAVRRRESWLTLKVKAHIHCGRGEWGQAVAVLDRAVTLEPTRLDLREFRGQVSINAKKWRQAVVDANFLLEHGGNASDALLLRGYAWVGLETYNRARADLEAALRADPSMEAAQAMLAALSGENPQATLASLDRIAEEHPQAALVHKWRGAVLVELKRYEAAIDAYTQSLELDHRQANTFMARAYCWGQLHEYDLAIADASKAINLDPRDASNWGARGSVLSEKGDDDLALADFTEAIRLSPRDPNWYARRGIAFEHECDYEHALEDFAKATELGDKSWTVRRHRTWIYLTCPDPTLRNSLAASQSVAYMMKNDKHPGIELAETAAALFAEGGSFDLAVKAQTRIVEAAQGKRREAARERLALYEAGKPYRSPTKRR